MPKLNFTQDEINSYFRGSCSILKQEAVCIADDMAVHADGCFPVRLVKERRPNEPEEVLKYREKIWEPITKPKVSQVLSSLQKIRRSSEWAIKYDDLAQFSRITEEEDLESYCEENFPMDFKSVTNWVFSILLRKQLIDPNAVILVLPLEQIVDQTAYRQPFPEIYDSCQQIDYREGDYAVLINPTGCTYHDEKGSYPGQSFYIITTQMMWKYDQASKEMDFQMAEEYNHGLGFLPVFKLKGTLIKQRDRQFLYESRIAAMLPELNEAVREYSDLQAAKVNHIYPERWEYTNNECRDCKGSGLRPNPYWSETCNCDHEISCNKCDGRGYIVAGPYSKMVIKPTDAMSPGTAIPSPPAGYIQKDVEVVKVQQDGVDAHLYKALTAINFQFLDDAPLNQSGVAKEVDKDELNNTVHGIAEDLIATMDKIYRCIAYYRYKDLYSADDIEDMLPDIAVPQAYDLLSTQNLGQELQDSKKNNVNPIIINALEIDYASRRFNDQEIRDMVALALELDPLPNIAEADKVIMLTNDGITQVTYVMSCNIVAFIQRAIDEDDSFPQQDLAEQKAMIQKYAQEQIDANNKGKALVKNMFMENGGNGLNNNNGNVQPNNQDNPGGSGPVQQTDSGNPGANGEPAAGSAPAA